MNPNPDREHMIFKNRYAEDLKRAELHRLSQPVRAPTNRIICRLLCGLGHRLVRWGQYLEQHFALPEDQPLTPRRL
jgi:hypothetical protein